MASIITTEVDEGVERVDAADAFVGVAACNDEAGDFGVDFIVEVGEDIGRKLCPVKSVGEGVGGDHGWHGWSGRLPRCAASTVWRRL